VALGWLRLVEGAAFSPRDRLGAAQRHGNPDGGWRPLLSVRACNDAAGPAGAQAAGSPDQRGPQALDVTIKQHPADRSIA